MNPVPAAAVSAAWLVVAPGMVCGLVPWLITGWRRPDESLLLVDVTGWLLVLAGAAVMVHAFVAFVRHGRGTPAPPAPTERLVVEGAYRYVRNPMYVAVMALVLGQLLLFPSWWLLGYLMVVGVVMEAFVRGYEEPTLHHAYGPAYDDFRDAVPRWVPRLTPWRGPQAPDCRATRQ